jgi:hypothetical protein
MVLLNTVIKHLKEDLKIFSQLAKPLQVNDQSAVSKGVNA